MITNGHMNFPCQRHLSLNQPVWERCTTGGSHSGLEQAIECTIDEDIDTVIPTDDLFDRNEPQLPDLNHILLVMSSGQQECH